MNKVKLTIMALIVLFVIDLSLFFVFLSSSRHLKTEENENITEPLAKDAKSFTINIPRGEIIIVEDCKKDK